MGVRPQVEEVARLCRELDSIVLSDEGRVAERKELESILAQIGDDPSLSDGERAIIADARSVLAREQASPSMWWSPSASPAVPAPRPSVEAPTRDEQLKKVSPLVRQTVEDVDDEASGKVLFADALSNRGREGLKRWALELQSIPNTPKGNYLHAWYLLLYDAYPESALKLGQIIADMGIEFGGNVSGFTNLEHLDPKEKLPPTMAPEVEKLPLSHGIDNFTSVQYDLTYRAHGGVLSNYLQLTYADGVTIDLDIHTISDDDDPAPFQAIAYSYVGAGGRVFPLRLDPDTTPRLVKAKHWAVGIMEKNFEDFEFFVSLSLAGVMSTLPIGPVTMEDPVPVGPGPRSTPRDVPAPASGEGAAAKAPDVSDVVPPHVESQPGAQATKPPQGSGPAADADGGPAKWVDENAHMSQEARDYQDSVHGARSNRVTKSPQAPEIEYRAPDGSTEKVRFDGVEGEAMIDRKKAVTTFPKSQKQALRQSEALRQNGLTGVWEVPSAAEATRATRMLTKLKIDNITVRVVKTP